MNIVALVISVVALVLSIVQFFRDSSREKKVGTLDAYNELQNDVFGKLNRYQLPMPNIEKSSTEWLEITSCLAKLERFSVGLNTGIFSFKILNRLGGAYFIRQYDKLEPIIKEKRYDNLTGGNHYDEFESAVKKLKKKRARKFFGW